ncbi:hypothetical protein ACSNOJ_31675 [Streptomyces sp. URMC 128]|uniref:hypothetical protein n=1 Tax=Streptomyces sp. URMC 128 TaxID=3423404 RepID=UPI003F1A76C2
MRAFIIIRIARSPSAPRPARFRPRSLGSGAVQLSSPSLITVRNSYYAPRDAKGEMTRPRTDNEVGGTALGGSCHGESDHGPLSFRRVGQSVDQPDPQAGRLTVRQHAERWLASLTTDPGTFVGTEQRIRLHVLPYLGSRTLGSLRPTHS